MFKYTSIKNFMHLKRSLSNNAFWINLILISSSIFYLFTLIFLDRINVSLNIESNNCKNYVIKGDVLDVLKLTNFSFKATIDNRNNINIKFPLRSKVFLMTLCQNKDLIIRSAVFQFGSNNKKLNLFTAVNNCYYCETKIENRELHVRGLTENSIFEIADYIHLLPFSVRILHYYLRYFPYLILLSCLIYYLIILRPFNKILIKSLIFSSFILISLLLVFDKIRKIMPPSRINEAEGVGLSQFKGLSVVADNILLYLLITIPYIVYLVFYVVKKSK